MAVLTMLWIRIDFWWACWVHVILIPILAFHPFFVFLHLMQLLVWVLDCRLCSLNNGYYGDWGSGCHTLELLVSLYLCFMIYPHLSYSRQFCYSKSVLEDFTSDSQTYDVFSKVCVSIIYLGLLILSLLFLFSFILVFRIGLGLLVLRVPQLSSRVYFGSWSF